MNQGKKVVIDSKYILDSINNFMYPSHNINLIRDYLAEYDKKESDINVFIFKLREKFGNKIFCELAKFIIDKKIRELNMTVIIKDNKIIKIY